MKRAPKREKKASIYGAILSVAVPLIIVVSAAIALVKTLTPFTGRSNHPIFFFKIPLYKSFLTPCVTFSPKFAKLNLFMKIEIPHPVATQAKKTLHLLLISSLIQLFA